VQEREKEPNHNLDLTSPTNGAGAARFAQLKPDNDATSCALHRNFISRLQNSLLISAYAASLLSAAPSTSHSRWIDASPKAGSQFCQGRAWDAMP
jgi:hypothetical protein